MHRLRVLRRVSALHRQQQCWATDALRRSSSSLQARRLSSSIEKTKSPNSRRHQYISLYNYTPLEHEQLPKLRRDLFQRWSDLRVLGRIYISQEGINAQLVVPETKVPALKASFPKLLENAKLFYGRMFESDNAAMKAEELFHKLDIRIRDQIVRDGFAKGHLDLQDSGNALPPREWHEKLRQRNTTNDDKTLVLDVRNFYEHDIGRFDGATRIMVDTFRDTFDAVDEILDQHAQTHGGEKPREVMMYCTGGIRCEKVGAYLAQYKGIKNVQKLHGGIVNYMNFLRESEDDGKEESLFKGKNFVFDQRCVANGPDATAEEEVTPDVLGECFQCGEPCNQHTNCANLMCHGLILQCASCSEHYHGACSDGCRDEVVKMSTMTPEEHRVYRKQHTPLWKPKNPNASASYQKFIKFRPVPPSLQQQQQQQEEEEEKEKEGGKQQQQSSA